MIQSDENALNTFLQEFPRNQIIDTLKAIDLKIGSLHTISSKDFLYFNKLLKEYHKRIKEIADTNNSITDFFNNELKQITEELKEKNHLQKKIIDDAKLTTNKIIDLLTLTYSSFDLIIVPFNNYKQNLITLKYLLANIKLHLTYINVPNKIELQHSINFLEQIIDKMQLQFESIASDSDVLNQIILQLRDNECIGKCLERSEAYEQLKMFSNQIRKLSFEEFWPDNYTLNLNRRTQNCFANMGEIITNIQYHDIIRQKMEHIQMSQQELIKGLTGLTKIEITAEYIQEQLNFLGKIPEITDVQVAQLLYTTKDYQTSIEKITVKLIEVGHEMKELNSLYRTLSESNQHFEESFLYQAKSIQGLYDSYLSTLTSDWNESLNYFDTITKQYHLFKEKYSSIFENEKSLRGELKNFERLLKGNGKSFGIELMSRLIILFTELKLNSNSLKTNLNNITQNFESLNKLAITFKPQAPVISVSKEDALSKLSEILATINKLAENYGNISIQISEEITMSLKSIEYYTYFKNTVEEIVTLLNNINKQVSHEHLQKLVGKNSDLLKKLEHLYTMKSERDVHAQTIDTENTLQANGFDQTNTHFEDDIELF